MAEKKVPLRKCTGCNGSFPKSQLIRVIKTPEGEIKIDRTGRQNGRGAYICDSKDCFEKARRSKGIERSLGVPIPEEIYESLLKEMIK
ncbi:MAG: YlxR family protein [Lachnospiraceae bacterium]|nr:YlxR family protein [Lachnospiraceae bacterium]